MSPDELNKYLEELRQIHESEDYHAVLEFVLEQEKIHPDAFEIHQSKSSLYGLLGKYESALDSANRAIELNPNDYSVNHFKGISLHQLGRHQEAVDAFDVAIKIDPNKHLTIERKITSLILLGRFREASVIYEQSDLPVDYHFITLNNLGCMYVGVGEYEKAGFYLYFGKRLNPFLPEIYLNLSRLYLGTHDRVRFLKHRIAYLLLRFFEKIGVLKKIEKLFVHKNTPEIEYYEGSGLLFLTKSQILETSSIFKVLRGMNMAALCNDTWDWFGINIPYDLKRGAGSKGDIDILLKRPRYFGPHDAGFTYRGFEVKVARVNKFGTVEKLYRGTSKLRKIKKQLEKIRDFGCEQVFLLEIFVLERGFSATNNFPSKEIAEEIAEKAKFLHGSGFGYVVMAEEPSTTTNDELGGIYHFPLNILRAQSNPIGESFQALVDEIDAFRSDEGNQATLSNNARSRVSWFIGYCNVCRGLTHLSTEGRNTYTCVSCGEKIY